MNNNEAITHMNEQKEYKYYEVSALYRANFIVRVSLDDIAEAGRLDMAISELLDSEGSPDLADLDKLDMVDPISNEENLERWIEEAKRGGTYLEWED